MHVKTINPVRTYSQLAFAFKTIASLIMIIALLCTQVRAQEPYTLAVVPQLPRTVLFEDWQPYLQYLSNELGVSFELQVQDSIPLFEKAFLAGQPDFAFMNPYHVVMAQQAQGYTPLISDASRQLKGILVVKATSDIMNVDDLNGQTIAFPAPNAFGASLYMRALLAERFEINITASYVNTHANVYRNVFLEQAAAGGGVMNTFNTEDAGLREQLRVLYETPGVTPHPLTAHPRVPTEITEQVIQATLALYDTPEGQAILQRIQLTQPTTVSYNDYQALELLNLESFLVVEP